MAKKKRDTISAALFKYYITFLLLLGSIFILSYLYLGLKISKSLDSNTIPLINIISGEYEDYEKIDVKDLNKIGGYIEVLNEDRKVVYVAGKAPEEKKDEYTEKELLEILSSNGEKDHNVFVNTMQNKEGEFFTVLVRVPNGKVDMDINLLSVPISVGMPLYKVYIKVILVAVLLFAISIIIYSLWTSKRIKSPLKKIDEALGRVIDGNYEERLEIEGEKEFIAISDTINYLIDKLKKSNEENKKLEESKTRMLMDLSHDIKTPITTIQGFSAALYEGLVEDEEQKNRYYKTIFNKSQRVSELVNDLFHFVKMDNVQYGLKVEAVDICEFMRCTILEYFDEFDENGFSLEVNIPENSIELHIDKKLFKRVIANLLENSIKYNERGTTVRVEVRDIGKIVVIEVADDGVGIPEDIRSTLFDEFVRGDKSRNSTGGTGLGLSIAKKIVENHGGEIKLINGRGNEKTIFYISMYK